jgi:hypothetical protein
MMAEYAMATSAVRVNIAELMSPRVSSGGVKLRSVVAIPAMKIAVFSHFYPMG